MSKLLVLHSYTTTLTHSSAIEHGHFLYLQVAEIHRANTILGVRIMGGADRRNHVFRQGDKPGIFVLHLLPEGAAMKCGSLRVGDRILSVGRMSVHVLVSYGVVQRELCTSQCSVVCGTAGVPVMVLW